MQEAVVIDCLRTPVGKSPRGTLRNTRPDELAATVIRRLLEKYLQVTPFVAEDLKAYIARSPEHRAKKLAEMVSLITRAKQSIESVLPLLAKD